MKARTMTWGITLAAAIVLSGIVLLNVWRISPVQARQYADQELALVADRLDIDKNLLIGPISVRESKNEFYFTWAIREHPDRPAIVVWVSQTGEAEATIIDDNLLEDYRRKYGQEKEN